MGEPRIYLNEINTYKAQWLRNLIEAGHLPPGDVDTRSIEDVHPRDLDGYDRCHFFAGIGGWALALEWAAWPRGETRVWTCGCPCQPFSAAGKRAGFADERHLWPAQHWLIEQCQPDVLLGEQVANGDGLMWLDLVQADMEASGYTGGATDICAAGFGAPHIRQRQWLTFARATGLADADRARLEGRSVRGGGADQLAARARSVAGGLADDALGGRREEHPHAGRRYARDRAEGLAAGLDTGGDAGGLADADGRQLGHGDLQRDKQHGQQPQDGSAGRQAGGGLGRGPAGGLGGTGAADTRWRDADWLYCSDGKWRPVEPGTFPLAHGIPGRVGRLRAYGETISPVVAAGVAKAFAEELGLL